MSNLKYACDELSFVEELLGSREQQYRKAYWLKSNFQENIWLCDLGNCKTINFHVKLEDDTWLTDEKNKILLEIFKCFLCIQTHFDATGGKRLVKTSDYLRVSRALHIIDYLLLNAKPYHLAANGVDSLSMNDFAVMLQKICSQSSIAESIYNWTERVSKFLKEKIQSLSEQDIRREIKQMTSLKDLNMENINMRLLLSDEQLIAARVWLRTNNFYKASTNWSHYKYSLNTRKLSRQIFKNTLSGCNAIFLNFDELSILTKLTASREYSGVPVKTKNDNGMNDRQINRYYCTLRSMGYLSTIDLDVPVSGINSLNLQVIKSSINIGVEGRYHTLPSQIVFSALRNSVEFALAYGELIINSYLKLVDAAIKTDVPTHRLNKLKKGIHHYLSLELKQLGIKCWSIIDRYNVGQEKSPHYFSKVRANEGLYELIRILYGAVQLCVGTLMARRQSELFDLKALNCLDQTETHLIFYVRKTGYVDKREKVARPIPAIAVKLIKLLEKLQKGLIKRGVLSGPGPLFAYPNISAEGLTQCRSGLFNANIDLFCDYFQSPLNQLGQRYYIRQHQLRRFFAMLFFWGSSLDSMDTLRWFLAHADVEHLYHYITEDIAGSVLKGTKAHYAAEQLQSLKVYDESLLALADVLEKHFDTRKFDILDADHLSEYIEDLLEKGEVDIEPEFFETSDGKKYRILIKVTHKANA